MSISKNILLSFFSRGWSVFLNLLLTPIYLKIIGVEAFAIIGITLSIHAVMGLFDLGLGVAITMETATLDARKEDVSLLNLFRTGEIVYWIVACLLFLLFWGFSPWIVKVWLHQVDPDVIPINQVLPLIGGAVLCNWPYTFYSAALLGLQRQDLVNVINLLSATVRAVLSISFLLWVSPTVVAFLMSYLVAGLFQVFLSAAILWSVNRGGFWKGRFTLPLLKQVGKRGLQFSVVGVLAILILNIDKAVLSHFLNLTQLGYYCFSWTFFSGIINLASIPLMIFGPKFSHLIALKEEKELVAAYHQASQWMATLIIPVATVLLYFLKDILLIWTGDETLVEHSSLPASLLILGATFQALYSLLQSFQLANRWVGLTIGMQSAMLLLLPPLLIFAADHAGVVGASLVWPLLLSAYLWIYSSLMHRRLLVEEKRKWWISDLILPATGALAVCGLSRLFITSPLRGPTGIGILLAIGLLATCATALMSNAILLRVKTGIGSWFFQIKS